MIAAALALALGLAAPASKTPVVAPLSAIESAPAAAWKGIPPSELMMITLAGDRRVVIWLAPEFAPAHVANLVALARADYWRGASVYRVQDNFVAQWGIDEEKRPLPGGVVAVPPAEYSRTAAGLKVTPLGHVDPFAPLAGFARGWPVSVRGGRASIAHCYGMVGVARDDAPDTGMGGELYAIIGQPARRLDRNLAVVGRVVEGIEHLSSLPRGPVADRGRYGTTLTPTPILSVRVAADLPSPDWPRYQRFDTDHAAWKRFLSLKPNEQNSFYRTPARGLTLCDAPVPVRREPAR